MFWFKSVVCWILLLIYQNRILCNEDVYTNDFAVQVDGDSENIAKLVALSHGCHIVKRIESLNVFHFQHPKLRRRSKRSAEHVLNLLRNDPNVVHVEQQKLLQREKRFEKLEELFNELSNDIPLFNDPIWPKQWYLFNHGQTKGPLRMDINVKPAWEAGFTGEGITTSVVDDGVDYTHPDLKNAYNANLSFDANGNDNDPFPNDNLESNGHGTKCAGVITAQPNDHDCGVGIAYGSKFAGIRALDGPITDLLESEALLYNLHSVDVVTASWGPPDRGSYFDGPHHYTAKVMKEGIENGRNGSGVIYVWAAGNGNYQGDFCSFDGYVNSIYTIPVGSLTHMGEKSYYSEQCSANFVSTFTGSSSYLSMSKGFFDLPNRIVTTDLHHKCSENFQGTSASAPVGAGCVALILSANSKLTWRDMQHIIASTARVSSIDVRDNWTINGAGYHVSPHYGFGALDCSTAIGYAQLWENVGEQRKCVVESPDNGAIVEDEENKKFVFKLDSCANVNKLEHAVLNVNMTVQNRGGVKMTLISPAGTISVLMPHRQKDRANSTKTFGFLTVMTWGENPTGEWTLYVTANDSKIQLSQMQLILYGTNDTKSKPNKNAESPTKEKLLKIIENEDDRTRRILPMKNLDLLNALTLAKKMNIELNNEKLRTIVKKLNDDNINEGTNWARELRKREENRNKRDELFDFLSLLEKEI